MSVTRGPFKTPPQRLPSSMQPERNPGDRVRVSQRSDIPAFEVMRITGEIARARAEGRDVVSLCAGEPAARRSPERLTSAGYTSPLGTRELREAIAGHYNNWYGVDVNPNQVAVTTGSSGAFQLGFLAAFDAGDRVAVASPGYPAYRNILRALGVEVVDISVGSETRYQPTPTHLDRVVETSGPIAGLVLASPANPTGSMLSREELQSLTDWCRAHATLLISDEIYHGITFSDTEQAPSRGTTAWEFGSDSLVVNSFSKYWAMTGWRLGWALLPEPLVLRFEALASNFSLSPPAPAQELALDAFTEETYAQRDEAVREFQRARELLLDAAPSLNWGPAAPSDGAFYYYADLGEQLQRFETSVAYANELLEQADVAVVPGTDFDRERGSRTVRLSYAAGEAVVAEAIDRILRFQKKYL